MAKRPAWSVKISAVENARTILPGMVRRFYRAARKAMDSVSPRDLHSLRLEAKRLRYTLELFEGMYGPGLAQRLSALRKVQGYLGDISDIATTCEMFKNAPDRNRPEVARLENYLKTRLAERTGAFRKYWKSVMDAPGEQERWTAYFARFARPEKAQVAPRRLTSRSA